MNFINTSTKIKQKQTCVKVIPYVLVLVLVLALIGPSFAPAAWAAVADEWIDDGTFLYPQEIGDDLVLGASAITGPFFFDVSESKLTVNHSSGDPTFDFQTANTSRWLLGIDDSDSDKFRLTPGGAFNATSSGITLNPQSHWISAEPSPYRAQSHSLPTLQ